MKGFTVCFLGLIFVLAAACSGKKAEYIASLDQLKRTSDSISFDLKKIDVNQLEALLTQSGDGLERMKQSIGADDTLEYDFAQMLERYLQARIDLESFHYEVKKCRLSNKIQIERIRLLKADIENDLGDRVDYEKNVKAETRELTKIRNHSIELKRRFEEAKSAIEQFQPEIERYLQQNAPVAP